MRRELGLALLLALAGGVLLLAAAGATWASPVVEGRAPLPDVTVDVQGADLVPGLRALGLLGLAGVPALLAVRRWGRTAVGALLLGAGVLAVVLVVRVLLDVPVAVARSEAFLEVAAPPADVTGQPDGVALDPGLAASPSAYGGLIGGALLAAAGLLAVVRGRSWPALGRRYDAPSVQAAARPAPDAPVGDKQVWEALDRGEDPTR